MEKMRSVFWSVQVVSRTPKGQLTEYYKQSVFADSNSAQMHCRLLRKEFKGTEYTVVEIAEREIK